MQSERQRPAEIKLDKTTEAIRDFHDAIGNTLGTLNFAHHKLSREQAEEGIAGFQAQIIEGWDELFMQLGDFRLKLTPMEQTRPLALVGKVIEEILAQLGAIRGLEDKDERRQCLLDIDLYHAVEKIYEQAQGI